MIENLKATTSQLIEHYIEILEENGEPDEAYKYVAINTFQQNWDLEAIDFNQMLRKSLSKVANLLYQNSSAYMLTVANHFPEEARAMFRNLYDASIEISQRIKTFQAASENILPKVRQALNRTNINAQQDERTLSVYLAFRYPEKYILYKADYYKNFCEQLNIKTKKAGERFLHLQQLADQIIGENLLEDEHFISTYRNHYTKPDWDDKYLMIQNLLYVNMRKSEVGFDLLKILRDFDRKNIEAYYEFLDKIIEKFELQENDQRLVFNVRNKSIFFTIGQRYIWRIKNAKNYDFTFEVISTSVFTEYYYNFEGNIAAFGNGTNDIKEIFSNENSVFEAIEKELNRTQVSGFYRHNKKELERMAFDKDFRNEILSQLNNTTASEEIMENKNPDNNYPLNQILYGAPGTGKTYNTKRIGVEIINGIKQRTRLEINAEYEELVNAKQIVFTTFHQSLSYEDFIEGIKPETVDGNVTYEVKDGIFKGICKRAAVLNDDIFEILEKFKLEISENEGKNPITIKSPATTFDVKYRNGNLFHVSPLNTSKKEKPWYSVNIDYIINYFNTGILTGTNQTYTREITDYLIKNSDLNTRKTEKRNYVLIIDEINRGNVSAIFGELITLIEESKRAGNDDAIEVTLPYSNSNEKFSVPNNVYIIGTMNTADRSVEALDTALRRRFSFVEMQPDSSILSDSVYQDVDLKLLLETINQRIEVLIDKDHQIGHFYFLGIKNLQDLKSVFKYKIIPLLEEYFYGDLGKIGLVLGGTFIYQEDNNAKFPTNFKYENDFVEDKKVYRFTPFEYWDEHTFIAVYED